MDMLTVNTVVFASQSCLAPAYQPLQSENLFRIHITFLLTAQELLHPLIVVLDHLVRAVGEDGVEAVGEVHETPHLLITHGNVSRCLVGHMHVVPLLHKSANGPSHGDHIIVGMR